jgi:hypothetical protein
MTNAKFTRWIDTFISEKGLDLDHRFQVEGKSGMNSIPLECLVDAIKSAPANEQIGIKSMIVKIDFLNKPVMPYFAHLAQAIAA